MLKKKLRLKTKDVRFLTRKGKKFYSNYFCIHSFTQYPNIKNNQISCHISIKYHKSAVKRVALKRIILQYIQENNIEHKQRNNTYYKIFIGLNKNSIETFKAILLKMDSTEKKIFIHRELEKTLQMREKKILSTKRNEKNEKAKR